MKRIQIISSLIFISITTTASTIVKNISLAERLFGTYGAQLDAESITRTQALFDKLSALSDEQRVALAYTLETIIQNEHNKLEQAIQTIIKDGGIASQAQYYLRFITLHEHKHLKKYSESITTNASFMNRIKISYEYWKNYLISRAYTLFGRASRNDFNQLVSECVWFIIMQRKEVLSSYEKFLAFIVTLNNSGGIPEPLNFWKNQTLQQKLKKRVQVLGPEVMIQFIAELFELAKDFVVQGIVLGGNSMAWSWVDAADEEEYNKLNAQVQLLTDNYSTFQQQEVEKQQTAATAIIDAFKTAQQTLSDQYNATNELLQTEVTNLNRSINLAQPATRYVTNQISFDVLFEQSPMYTPNNGYPWYNIYQAGDWEFNSSTNSFWQYQYVPFGTPFWQSADTSKGSDPSSNGIFCEYISPTSNYTITIEMTLISAQYPFFAGIMFNKSRWISGDPERLWGYRLVGLYGSPSTTTTPTSNNTISFAFAETVLQLPKTADDKEKITSPLESITTAQQQPFTLPQTITDALAVDPQKFTITIETQLTSATLTISQNETQLYSTTMQNLKPYYSIFHGLGFLAPGCQAEFKIIAPSELVYTQAQINDFVTTISGAIS